MLGIEPCNFTSIHVANKVYHILLAGKFFISTSNISLDDKSNRKVHASVWMTRPSMEITCKFVNLVTQKVSYLNFFGGLAIEAWRQIENIMSHEEINLFFSLY